MMSKSEVLDWVQALPDDAEIGIDDGGLTITTPDGQGWLEIGGIPLCESCSIALNECDCAYKATKATKADKPAPPRFFKKGEIVTVVDEFSSGMKAGDFIIASIQPGNESHPQCLRLRRVGSRKFVQGLISGAYFDPASEFYCGVVK